MEGTFLALCSAGNRYNIPTHGAQLGHEFFACLNQLFSLGCNTRASSGFVATITFTRMTLRTD